RLRHASLAGTSADPSPVLDRQPGAEAARAARAAQTPSATLSPEATRGLRRLSLFLEHLQAPVAGSSAGGTFAGGTPARGTSLAPIEQRREVASQFMTAAAVQSSSAKELEEHLAPLRQFGVDTTMDQVLRTLARTLPGWGSLPVAAGSAPPLVGLQLNAMRQIVSLAEAPEEAATRFGEPRRERRHQLLAMLEAHGEAARAKAWELLKPSVESPEAALDPFFQMNLVYLLRVIPRPAAASVEDEVNVVMRTPGRDSPPPLVKQVIGYLAALRHEKSERALITYLRLFENMVLQPETAVYSPADIETLLDRTCIALARYATPRSWRALVDHGLKAEPRLGSPMARLVEAGRQDLSGSKDLVERVIAALRAELPRRVLGFTVKKNDDRIVWLIQALSGTPLPEVRAVLQEILDKHGDKPFAEAASKALAAMEAGVKPAEPAGAGLSGDLELFGLPGVLQTISQSQLTGVLSLMKVPGKVEASILLEGGRFRGAQFAA